MSVLTVPRTDQSLLARWWWTIDWGLLAAIFSLFVFGIVLVTTASPSVATRVGLDPSHFIVKHIILVGPALILMIAVSFLDPRNIWRFSSLIFAVGLVLVFMTLFIGMEIKGAQRWIHLPGFSLQPSEFVKPAFAVVAAWLIALQKENPDFSRGNLICAGMYFLAITLLLLQPDFGMTFVLTFIFMAQIFLAGLPFRYLFFFGCIGVIGMLLIYFSLDHVQTRIDRFLDPGKENYQAEKSLEAFQEGGIIGVGPGQGDVKLRIPDAHADFIFSVLGEEGGLFSVIIMIGLFAFIILRGFNRLMESEDMFVILATGGLLTMFGLQALIHMGSSLDLLPTKGMTLPLISYGGSSLLSMSMSLGMVLALTRRRARSGIGKGRKT